MDMQAELPPAAAREGSLGCIRLAHCPREEKIPEKGKRIILDPSPPFRGNVIYLFHCSVYHTV